MRGSIGRSGGPDNPPPSPTQENENLLNLHSKIIPNMPRDPLEKIFWIRA